MKPPYSWEATEPPEPLWYRVSRTLLLATAAVAGGITLTFLVKQLMASVD